MRGEYAVTLPDLPADETGRLGSALLDLAGILAQRQREQCRLDRITQRINAGLMLDEILDNIYHDFRELIPYNRIGFALIEDDGQTVRACWARSDQPAVQLGQGYSAPLASSSLEAIMTSGQPRILNDLESYLGAKPGSEATRMIVGEGLRASLTCPLIANGAPVGFIFFSSIRPHIYEEAHVELFQRIAGHLAVIVEKGRLVSELAAQKEAIERQNGELLRLSEMKNSFVGMAAHDLRNPLSMIQMAVEVLLEIGHDLEAHEQQQILHDVDRQTNYMLDLIENLLDLAQIEAGKLELRPELLPVEAFLREAVIRHGRLATRKSISVQLGEVPPGTLTADPLRLRQVVDNLLSNAVKFSPPGSTVLVSAERLPGGWQIGVRDQGPGISPEERAQLFQVFGRLSSLPTAGERTSGLGLAILRRVVEAHGGSVGVDSEPGGGSLFWFTLPG